MLIVVSPAKTLDYESPLPTTRFTQPELTSHSAELIKVCRTLTPQDIADLMKVSDKIAGLNVARFEQWTETSKVMSTLASKQKRCLKRI